MPYIHLLYHPGINHYLAGFNSTIKTIYGICDFQSGFSSCTFYYLYHLINLPFCTKGIRELSTITASGGGGVGVEIVCDSKKNIYHPSNFLSQPRTCEKCSCPPPPLYGHAIVLTCIIEVELFKMFLWPPCELSQIVWPS